MAKGKKKAKKAAGLYGYVVDPLMKARVDLLLRSLPPNATAAQLIHGLQAIGYQIAPVPISVISTRITGTEHVIRAGDILTLAAAQNGTPKPTMPPAGPPRAAPTPDNVVPAADGKRARPKHRPGAVKRKAKSKPDHSTRAGVHPGQPYET